MNYQNIWWKRAVLLSSAVTVDVRSARLMRAHRLWVADATDWQRRRWFVDRTGSTPRLTAPGDVQRPWFLSDKLDPATRPRDQDCLVAKAKEWSRLESHVAGTHQSHMPDGLGHCLLGKWRIPLIDDWQELMREKNIAIISAGSHPVPFYCFVTWFLNHPITKQYIVITVSSIVIKFAGYG